MKKLLIILILLSGIQLHGSDKNIKTGAESTQSSAGSTADSRTGTAVTSVAPAAVAVDKLNEIKKLYDSLTNSQKETILKEISQLDEIFKMDQEEKEFTERKKNNPEDQKLKDEYFARFAPMVGKEWGKRLGLQMKVNNFIMGETVVLERWPSRVVGKNKDGSPIIEEGSPKKEGRVQKNPKNVVQVFYKIYKTAETADNPKEVLGLILATLLTQ